jgi:gliding motility-associated-like protein
MKARVVFLLVMLFSHRCALAQKVVTQNPVFATSGQSMWGGGSSPGLNRNFEIFPKYSVNLPFNTSSFTKLSFSGLDFGAVLDGNVAFGVGPFDFDISGFTLGEVAVNYPATVRLEMPDDNTFNPGETIVIKSSFQAAPGAELLTTYPQAGKIGLYMGVMFDASFGFSACFIDCTPRLSIIPPPGVSLPTPLYDNPFTFFEVSQDGVKYLCNNTGSPDFILNPFQCTFTGANPPWTISDGAFSGTLNIPNVVTTSTVLNGRDLAADGADPYLTASVDVVELLGYIPPIKAATSIIQGSYTIPIAPDITGTMRGITLDWAVVRIGLDIPIRQSQDFKFEPRIFTTLTFPDTVDYVVHSMRSGNLPGRGVSFEYEEGDSVSVRFPCNYDYMDVYATHRIGNRFSNKTFDNIALELDFDALDFGLTIDPYIIIPEICIPIPFYGDLCLPEIGFPGATIDPPPLFDPDPITLISQDFPPYFQDQWELGGFNTFDVPQPFRLKPRERQVNFALQNVTCNGDSTGSIVTTVPGASMPLQYEWSFGSSDANPVNVPAGRHYVKITDANRCESIESVEILQPPPIAVALTPGDILCYGGTTEIKSVASGGTGALSYAWNTGESAPLLNAIPAGTYSLNVTDAAGCMTSDSVTLAEPTRLVAKISDAIDPTCAGVEDGSLALFVEGGTAPYRYTWSNGSSLPDQQNLGGGDYTIEVTDAHNCVVSDVRTLLEPPLLKTQMTKLSDVSCYAGSDAALQISPSGGTPPYRYRWYDSLVTLSTLGPSVSGLSRGVYSVEVTDSRDCQVVQNMEVLQPAAPLQVDIFPLPGKCNGQATGSLDLKTQGGTPPYAFSWSTGQTVEDLSNVPAGKYEVTVTDAEGCQSANKTLLVEPPPISITLSERNVSCADGADGKIAITRIREGLAPYDIMWSTGESGESIENLVEGVYSVRVTDAAGCSSTREVDVFKNEDACLFIPNAFSPNGDGTNDTWNIRHMELYADAEVRVFNKWGSVVFESRGYSKAWDGTYHGKTLEPATYYYFVDLRNGDPIYEGFLMILQ